MDEFYGGYNYTSNCDGTTVSAAENIVDVDEDDVLLVRKFPTHFPLILLQSEVARQYWGQAAPFGSLSMSSDSKSALEEANPEE